MEKAEQTLLPTLVLLNSSAQTKNTKAPAPSRIQSDICVRPYSKVKLQRLQILNGINIDGAGIRSVISFDSFEN